MPEQAAAIITIEGLDKLQERIIQLAEVAGRLERVLAKLEVTKPKQTVTKEAQTNGHHQYSRSASGKTDYNEHGFLIPNDARNIRCTYEVTE